MEKCLVCNTDGTPYVNRRTGPKGNHAYLYFFHRLGLVFKLGGGASEGRITSKLSVKKCYVGKAGNPEMSNAEIIAEARRKREDAKISIIGRPKYEVKSNWIKADYTSDF